MRFDLNNDVALIVKLGGRGHLGKRYWGLTLCVCGGGGLLWLSVCVWGVGLLWLLRLSLVNFLVIDHEMVSKTIIM